MCTKRSDSSGWPSWVCLFHCPCLFLVAFRCCNHAQAPRGMDAHYNSTCSVPVSSCYWRKGSRQGRRGTDVSASGLELSAHSPSSCSHWPISHGSVERTAWSTSPGWVGLVLFCLFFPGRENHWEGLKAPWSLKGINPFWQPSIFDPSCITSCAVQLFSKWMLKLEMEKGGRGGLSTDFLSYFGQIPSCVCKCFPGWNLGVTFN